MSLICALKNIHVVRAGVCLRGKCCCSLVVLGESKSFGVLRNKDYVKKENGEEESLSFECVLLVMMMRRRRRKGRSVHTYIHRVFLVLVLVISSSQADKWRNPSGATRKAFVCDYELTDPLDPKFKLVTSHLVRGC